MLTYNQALSLHDITIPDHLIADTEVPVLTGLQCQGDVIIAPFRPGKSRRDQLSVPAAGVQVVRGEAGGNTHWLNNGDADAAPCLWSPGQSGGQTLGVLTVPAGQSAYLIHTDEHGANGIAPGTYELRRQREQADEIRMVAD